MPPRQVRQKEGEMCRATIPSCVVAVLIACLPASGLRAQEAADTNEGVSMQEVMLAFLGAEQEDLLLGAVPEDSATVVLVPPRGRVLGSLVGDESLIVLVESALGREEVSSWLDQTYRAASWMPIDFGRQRGGFNPSPAEVPSQFCRDGAMVHVGIEEHADGSRLSYHYNSMRRMGMSCEAMQRNGMDRMERFEFPPLTAPEGAEQRYGGGRCSGSGGESIGTGLFTDLQAVEVLDHYSAQLAEAGWLSVASCWDGPVAMQAWYIEGEEDEPMSGMLLVERLGDRVTIQLSASRASEQ